MKSPNPDTPIRNFHSAWVTCIRGDIVSDHAARLIKNFLLAVLAEGRHHDKIDEVEKAAPPDMQVELAELSLARVHQLVNTQIHKDARKVEKDDRETGSRRLLRAMEVTASFWQLPENRNKVQIPAQQHCLTKQAEDKQPGAEERAAKLKKAGAALYKGRWQDRYQRWRANQIRRRKSTICRTMALPGRGPSPLRSGVQRGE